MEFVVIFPVAMLVVLCLIQFGFLHMGKLTLNHATFMAARAGSTQNARVNEIRAEAIRGLVPFYQNSTTANHSARIGAAYVRAQLDSILFLQVDRISPNAQTLQDFGVTINGQQQIPHDNLRWRNTQVGARSGVNIQDANLLKVKVTYGYELKVPLMARLVRVLMCTGGDMPMSGLGGPVVGPVLSAPVGNCLRYYMHGRVPIESFATVEMQSPVF